MILENYKHQREQDKMTSRLGKILRFGAIGLASLLPIKKAEAQGNVHGNIEYIQSEISENSYPRLNAFYSLPQRIEGYTFMELYQGGKGYFGRTTLDRAITRGVGPRAIVNHIGEPFTETGLGVGAVVPHMPRNSFATVGALPLFVDKQGRRLRHQGLVQYFFSTPLPLKLNLSGFGEWNILAENGPEWGYGEFNLGRKIGPFMVTYNPALLNDGDAMPKVEHRVAVTLNFGGTN